MTWLLAIRTFLKDVPWQIWAGIALIAAAFVYGEIRYSAGKEVILERLREAERERDELAEKARKVAGENAEERAREFEHEQRVLKDAIKDAEANGGNALDSIFGSLSDSD